jgi:signal transduction histidine kinase
MRGLEFLDRAVDYYVRRATTLLEISRINTGRMSLEPTAVDLSALTQDAVRRYAFLAERAGTTIEARDVQSGVVGFCDRMSVEQVLDNLLSNAVKYGYEKPIEVALTADGAQATLRVRDHGAGISADDQARIFERFEQAAGQRGQGGFGIGLWLARQLVEAMDGAIDVESRLDQGSTFTVRLPLWTPRRTQQQQDQP